jgi:hypothetical protein
VLLLVLFPFPSLLSRRPYRHPPDHANSLTSVSGLPFTQTAVGLFNFLESSMLRLVLYYFPMYFTFKVVAILWLVLPQTRVSWLVISLHPVFVGRRVEGSSS